MFGSFLVFQLVSGALFSLNFDYKLTAIRGSVKAFYFMVPLIMFFLIFNERHSFIKQGSHSFGFHVFTICFDILDNLNMLK